MNSHLNYEVDLENDPGFQWSDTLVKTSIIDGNRLIYNSTYNTYEFFASKFPPGFEDIPGFSKVIENIAKNAKTPFEEIQERILSVDKYNERDYSNIPKL
jgi:hypothetical protein